MQAGGQYSLFNTESSCYDFLIELTQNNNIIKDACVHQTKPCKINRSPNDTPGSALEHCPWYKTTTAEQYMYRNQDHHSRFLKHKVGHTTCINNEINVDFERAGGNGNQGINFAWPNIPYQNNVILHLPCKMKTRFLLFANNTF